MGKITFGIPKELVLELKRIFSIDLFIETGTFQGGTTSWAAKHFKEVYTVENSKELHAQTSAKFSHLSNIKFLLGNSPAQLKQIFNATHRPAILWLDAHWCGGLTYGAHDECPLLDEIREVIASNQDHIILIDDARLFLKPPSTYHADDQWPGLNEIIPLLLEKKGYYTFTCEDIIAAVPIKAKAELKHYFDTIHANEFPGGGLISNLKFVYRNIKRKYQN